MAILNCISSVNVAIVILQRKRTTETIPAPPHKKDRKEDKQS